MEESYLANEISSEKFFMAPLGVDYAKYNACETADARDDGFTTVFVGNVNPEKGVHLLAPGDLRPNDRRASLFVLPSLHESFGLVALEAMAAGLPVIISDNVGSRDCVDVGVNGLIFEHGNADALKDTINAFYRDPQRAREFGRESCAMAAKFDWPVAVGQLLKALKKIAAKG